MTILHLVLFRFKSEVAPATQQEILQEFLTLPQKCKDALQNLYIRDIRGGVECTPGASSDFTHIFIVEFDSMQQREYYKSVDPVHVEFASRIMPLLSFIEIPVFQESKFLGQ